MPQPEWDGRYHGGTKARRWADYSVKSDGYGALWVGEAEESGQKRMTHKGQKCSSPATVGNGRVFPERPFLRSMRRYSTRSFALAARVVCHCIFECESAPLRRKDDAQEPVPPRPPIAAESALAICTYAAPSEISPRRETLRPTRPTPENQKPFQLTVIYCHRMHKLVF
jgi:hypothetical protein